MYVFIYVSRSLLCFSRYFPISMVTRFATNTDAKPGVVSPSAMTEDAAGFFSWSPSYLFPPSSTTTTQPISEVFIIYPHGKWPLRLHASYLHSPSASTACAKIIPGLSVIASKNITAAANPEQFLPPITDEKNKNNNKNNNNNGNKKTTVTMTRRGLALQIFDYPCKVILRS